MVVTLCPLVAGAREITWVNPSDGWSGSVQTEPTVTTACPLLGQLHANSGPTFTHALLSRSPAIDAGSNPLNLATDQNLSNRVSGASIDIGAYEVQQGDIVFNANFEGCP